MEHSQEENPTPHFAWGLDNKALCEDLLGRRITKSDKNVPQCVKNKEKNKKCKNKENSKNKNKEKNKSKSKEKNKNKQESSKPKKKIISSVSLPIGQKYDKNPFDIFLQKKIKLRDDFDQNHSEIFLSEKELAFQQFQMNEDADNLDN